MYRFIFCFTTFLTLLATGDTAQAQSTTWIGQAPFCTAKPTDCDGQGLSFVRTHASGDGETCLIGTKVQCEGDIASMVGSSGRNVAACPYNAQNIKGSLSCKCSAPQTQRGSIWGSGTYTADSSVCRSARHAGAIGANGGTVRITKKPGQNSYRGSTANGVTTRSWKKYPNSFQVSK